MPPLLKPMFCVFLCALCVQGKATSHTSILPHNSLVSNATPAHIFATTTLARQSTIATQDSQDLNTLKNSQDSQDLHSSPQSLSLESCITKARAVYPLQKNKRLLDESLKLELTRVHFSYIPHIRFNGRVSYQSDVTTLPFNSQTLGSIPPLANALADYRPLTRDQYNINAEISQPLLDSLNLWANKAVIKQHYAIQKASIDVELYKVQKSVMNAYFSSLLLQKHIEQMLVYKQELLKNYATLQTLHKNGVAKASDVDKLHIEILNTDKTLQHLNAQKTTALTLLGELTQLDMTHYALQIPDKEDALAYLQRIQAKLYEIENEWRDAANQDSTNVDSINKDSTNQNPHNKDSIAQDSYNAIPQNLNAQDSTTKDFLAKESKQSQRKTNFFIRYKAHKTSFKVAPSLHSLNSRKKKQG